MKVYEVLVENKKVKQVDEGPLRFIKRKLGNKAAQLDYEVDQEVDRLYKDFAALAKQDPQGKGMTIAKLSNFMKQSKFKVDPKSVGKYYLSLPQVKKALQKRKKARQAPKGSGLAPAPTDTKSAPTNTQVTASIYGESQLNELGPAALDKKSVKQIMKKFVQQGLQSGAGARVKKSAFGDAPADAPQAQQKAGGKQTKDMTLKQALAVIKKAGYSDPTPPNMVKK
tara:strand:+ start:61 stop:735 length:675 start_codon:yes stop_codon:yes gene_type:complete